MSHEVLITRRQSIFDFFANPGRGRPQKVGAGRCWLVGMLRPPSAWICKKIKNALSPGYQDLMGHLILTTSSWSVLTWITLLYMYVGIYIWLFQAYILAICSKGHMKRRSWHDMKRVGWYSQWDERISEVARYYKFLKRSIFYSVCQHAMNISC